MIATSNPLRALSTSKGSVEFLEAIPTPPSSSNDIYGDSANVWSQEVLPTTQEGSESFDLMDDFGLVEYDMSASEYADLSHVFDTAFGPPLPFPTSEEAVQPENLTQDAASGNSRLDITVFGQPAASSPRSAQLKRARGSTNTASTMCGRSHASNPLSQESIPWLAAHGHRPIPTHNSLARLPANSNSTMESNSPERSEKTSPSHTHAGTTATSHGSGRLRKFPLQSTTDSLCNAQCHANLSEQLSRLSECQSDECSLPLDMLLHLDEYVRLEKEKVLRCPSCLGKTRSRQTLMLVIMVLEKLLSLFEREYDVDQVLSTCTFDVADSVALRQGQGNLPRYRHRESNQSSKPLSPLPYTNQPLIIGNFEVDGVAKTAFSKQLLRIHFERQMATVSELDQMLATGAKDVSYKVAWEILVDIYRRVEFLQGIMDFNDK